MYYGYSYYRPNLTVVIISWVVWIIVSRVIAGVFWGMDERKGYYGNHHYWALCFWLGLLGIIISLVITISIPEKRNYYYDPRYNGDNSAGNNANSIGDLYSTHHSSPSNTQSSSSSSSMESPDKIDYNDAYHSNLFKDDV